MLLLCYTNIEVAKMLIFNWIIWYDKLYQYIDGTTFTYKTLWIDITKIILCKKYWWKKIFSMRHILNVRHSFEWWRIMQLSKNKHPYQLIYFLLTQKKHSLCVIRCIFFKYAQTQICVNQLSELCFGSGTLIWIFGNSLLSKNVTRKYFMKSFKE